jgi:hypothetical protein
MNMESKIVERVIGFDSHPETADSSGFGEEVEGRGFVGLIVTVVKPACRKV